MLEGIKAVIFDMDGVLIDSEPLWRRAMIRGFSECGMNFTDEDCRKTTGRRFDEVVSFWLNQHQITTISATELESKVVAYLLELIEQEGKPIDGVLNLLNFCKEKNLKIGLATSSAHAIMNAVLKKLNLKSMLEVCVSAEYLKYGKPHPEVFLHCVHQLNVLPHNCLVIEDSINGIVAAKAAQMQVIAVPDNEHMELKQFALADYVFKNMHEVLVGMKAGVI